MKKYGIWFCVLFLGCIAVLTAAFQFSFRYSKEKAQEEARIKQAVIKEEKEKQEYAVADEGNVSKEDEVFYLTELNGFVAVYKSDKKTIYEYTNIEVENLPEDVRNEIKNGKEIRSVEKLYGFLENYSS